MKKIKNILFIIIAAGLFFSSVGIISAQTQNCKKEGETFTENTGLRCCEGLDQKLIGSKTTMIGGEPSTTNEFQCIMTAVPKDQPAPVQAAPIKIPEFNVQIPGLTDLGAPQEVTENGQKYLVIPWLATYIAGVYKYALSIVTIFAVLMIMVGGIIWLTGGGSADKVSRAKDYIQGALIGLMIALFSYLILYTINPGLVKYESLKIKYVEHVETENEEASTSNTVCHNQLNPKVYNAQDICESTEVCDGSNPCAKEKKAEEWCCVCTDCQTIPNKFPRKEGAKDLLSKVTISALDKLLECTGSGNWVITEAYPPNVRHLDKDHYNGRAVDIGLRVNGNPVPMLKQMSDEQKTLYDKVLNCLKPSGFNTVADEYITSYETTTGGHFHIEP